MSNPLRAPLNYVPGNRTVFPDAYLDLKEHPKLQDVEKVGKNLDVWRARLADLDLEPCRSMVIQKKDTVLAHVHQKTKDAYATAQNGGIQLRIRGGTAYNLCRGVFACLPESEEQYPFVTKRAVGDRAEVTLRVSGGTIYSMNRIMKYYPKRGAVLERPITKAEAATALRSCGLDLAGLEPDQLKPYPLIYDETKDSNMRINTTSDNGFPVGGDMTDALAAGKVFGFAKTIRMDAMAVAKRTGPRSLYGWVREQEESVKTSVFWALKGKTKGDSYKKGKVADAELRFYNVFPRQVMLNQQVATQVLEKHSRNILEDPETLHSGIGVSLVRGGAQQLVLALQKQLDAHGAGFTHVGDDSWVVVQVGDMLVSFALDCSSFDWTQHGDCTLEVHGALRNTLERVDAVAANLWYALARERVVVLVGGAAVRMKHAGPSGMPLQSKVNDMLMDVMIRRTLTEGTEAEWLDEGQLDKLLQRVGDGMGFKVRLEAYKALPVKTLKDFLAEAPVLFIGYYFYVEEGVVRVVADLPRSMAQMPYPSQNWVKKRHDLDLVEAMRMGSIYMSQGIYPKCARKAQETFQMLAEDLLVKAIEEYGDVEEASLKFAVSGDVHGPEAIPSLSGLLEAVRRPLGTLWDPELPSESTFVLLDWAGEVEEEERTRGADRPVDETARYPAKGLGHVAQPTHPVTWANWGRPPPTAVWTPAKAPKQREQPAVRQVGSKKVRLGSVYPGEDSEEFLSDLDDDHYENYDDWE